MKQRELQSHGAQVGLRLELASRKHDRFGWDKLSEEIKTLLRADWTAALMDYPIDELDAAIASFTLSTPNKCPNEGHIRQVIIANRTAIRARQPKPEEPEREKVPFDAEKIMREVGFRPKKFNDKPEG
jgi:hypothetical protein